MLRVAVLTVAVPQALLEEGETLTAEEQSWVDAKLDRIDELMQKLGLSYDDEEDEEEDEKQEDMMRLLKGGN